MSTANFAILSLLLHVLQPLPSSNCRDAPHLGHFANNTYERRQQEKKHAFGKLHWNYAHKHVAHLPLKKLAMNVIPPQDVCN